jgi:hypothetical protein
MTTDGTAIGRWHSPRVSRRTGPGALAAASAQRDQHVGLRVGALLVHPGDGLAGAGLDIVVRDPGLLGELGELSLVPGPEPIGAGFSWL